LSNLHSRQSHLIQEHRLLYQLEELLPSSISSNLSKITIILTWKVSTQVVCMRMGNTSTRSLTSTATCTTAKKRSASRKKSAGCPVSPACPCGGPSPLLRRKNLWL